MVTVPTYGCREETLRAEGNFIKRGIISQENLQTVVNPLILQDANEVKLKGGDFCIRGQGIIDGKT